jgi:hypothetical protein
LAAANDTVIFSVVLVLCDVHAGLPKVVADIPKTIVTTSKHFDDLIAASSCHDCVRWCNSRDNVLDHTHRQFVVDTVDTEFRCAFLALLANPLHVDGAIFVDSSLEVLRPLYHVCVLNTVLWLAWNLLDCTQRVGGLWRQRA